MNLPYNTTSFPNFLGHQSQRESSVSWESSLFPALVQTGCYQFLMFYACTLLVPKCDPLTMRRVPPCRSVSAALVLGGGSASDPPPGRSLCQNAKGRCESVLSIVGLQWPEDSDCTQFPEEGANVTCLLPEAGVDGTDCCHCSTADTFLWPVVLTCFHGDRVLPQPLQVPLGPLRPGQQTLRWTPGL